MIIEIKINASGSKFGGHLANTELTLDSDNIDPTTVVDITGGMVKSTLARADEKLKKQAAEAPPPKAEAMEPASF